MVYKDEKPHLHPAMKTKLLSSLLMTTMVVIAPFSLYARPNPQSIGASPQAIGDSGVAWYTTWDTALTEAERSQRPIFFMSAAAQCNGISGMF